MQSTLIDVNKRAVHLCAMNIKSNGVCANTFESNIYDNVEGKFDVIITNPPIRAGKKTVLDILLNANEHLNSEGELWLVIRKDQGAKSVYEALKEKYNANIVEKSKGFYIIVCKNY
jgi:16S rRNA (guanine1207-N2)-methyltransferase